MFDRCLMYKVEMNSQIVHVQIMKLTLIFVVERFCNLSTPHTHTYTLSHTLATLRYNTVAHNHIVVSKMMRNVRFVNIVRDLSLSAHIALWTAKYLRGDSGGGGDGEEKRMRWKATLRSKIFLTFYTSTVFALCLLCASSIYISACNMSIAAA